MQKVWDHIDAMAKQCLGKYTKVISSSVDDIWLKAMFLWNVRRHLFHFVSVQIVCSRHQTSSCLSALHVPSGKRPDPAVERWQQLAPPPRTREEVGAGVEWRRQYFPAESSSPRTSQEQRSLAETCIEPIMAR